MGSTGRSGGFLLNSLLTQFLKMREDARRLAIDVHAQFRAQTVRNLDAWYRAFKMKPGEKLYLAPKNRMKIW